MESEPRTPCPGERPEGFGRDEDLEKDRATGRPATSDLDATKRKADEEPVIRYAPDPDAEEPSFGRCPPTD